ncbi:MAG: hypothetical protein LC640_08915 [Frankia sp.]|nr:hypothetical protein [Frankia sp.]
MSLSDWDRWAAASQLATLIEKNHRHEPQLALLAWARWAERLDLERWTEAMAIHHLARTMLVARGVDLAA